ncbi:MAG TPA: hypothetical protein VMU07_04260 [Candidatus Paceibacterota bacterium]|nr:hypothetical protein [Candidatus Paceibacterota bacterium]
MSPRRAKQLIYGTLYAIIWLAFFSAIYFVFIKPAITPTPCEGPACGSQFAKPISTSTLWAFTAGPGSATYLAKIVNTNSDFGAAYFDYNINFYDASGTVKETIPGTSYIYPNQIKYLLAPNIAPVGEPYTAIVISNEQWMASSSMGSVPQFAFTNIQAQSGPATISVNGQVTNNDVASFDKVLIIAIFKDGSGNPIAATQTELDNFKAGDTRNFSVIYPAVSGVNPANNELEAYALRASM